MGDVMSIPKKAFDIPAISNEKEALMIFLKLDNDNAEDRAKVIEIDRFKLDCPHAPLSVIHVSVFQYENTLYHVAPSSARIQGVCNMEFNSNHWTIAPQASAPANTQMQSESSPQKETCISLYLTRSGMVAFQVFKWFNHKGEDRYRYNGKHGAGCGSLQDIAKTILSTLQSKPSIKHAEGIDFRTMDY